MKNIWKTWQNFRSLQGHQHYGGCVIHQPASNTTALPNNFRLFVWNAFKGCKGITFEDELLGFASQAQVICLQEVMFAQQPQLPAALGTWSWDYSPSYQRGDGLFEGVMTLAKHQLTEQGVRLASIGTEPVMATPKSAVATTLLCENGQTLLIINVHMLLFRGLGKAALELAQLIEHIAAVDSNTAVLVVGDFNTLLPHQLMQLDEVMASENLQRLIPEQEPRKLRRLDHIYCRNIAMAQLTVVTQVKGSDHPALLCDIRLSSA